MLGAIGVAMVLGSRGPSFAGPVEARPELPVNRGLMQRMGNFTLKEVTTGLGHSLYALRGSRDIVLGFIGTDRPVGNLEFVDLDVPVGTPPFPSPELAPTSERTAIRAIRAIRCLMVRDETNKEPAKKRTVARRDEECRH
jgi:hypothetical protein